MHLLCVRRTRNFGWPTLAIRLSPSLCVLVMVDNVLVQDFFFFKGGGGLCVLNFCKYQVSKNLAMNDTYENTHNTLRFLLWNMKLWMHGERLFEMDG